MKKFIKFLIGFILLTIFLIFSINIYVINKYKDKVFDDINNLNIEQVDAIVVLGAKVNEKYQVSLMLKDRLDKSIELYNNNISNTILMTGDDSKYETRAMKNYAKVFKVDVNDVLEDQYGVSTYDSMYRLKSIYDYKKVIVVSQKYHLPRAIYIANTLGIEAYGVSAKDKEYKGSLYRETREILARCKDYMLTLINYRL